MSEHLNDRDELTEQDEPVIRDPLAPWGTDGPPPSGQWRTDVLGEGFVSRTIDLLPDDEGPVVATLVRHDPENDPNADDLRSVDRPIIRLENPVTVLYLHGRNDYYFQRHLARHISALGGRFYALDLRKYGRSLRPWQTIGFISDIDDYDEDMGEALDIIRGECPDGPLIVMGHSTGGLIATLWAWRHPGALDGLVLNSPWLEMQTLAAVRSAVQPVLGRIAARTPLWEIPASTGPDHYGRSLMEGWSTSGFDLPEELRDFPDDDPAFTGWDYLHEWKRPEGYPVYAQWLDAILVGHEKIEHSVSIDCPILSMMSTHSYFDEKWSPEVFRSDTVLDADVLATRSAHLGSLVTIARFDGRHDLVLSDPDVRQRVWYTMDSWLEFMAHAL